ncbi:VOC family protein [Paenibacillus senegalensis]|uniref:VOC family protein n=1 Tax=Paenibacillus senegalensis TaxID=1465766 RepID=UPI0002896A0E|nr:VOC family protein [Paenibacillus senegalensis]
MAFQLCPYLSFNGTAKQAISFYKETFNAEIVELMTYGDMPDELPVEWKELVAHSRLRIQGTELMISDSPNPVPQGKQVSICLTFSSLEQCEQIYEALIQEGTVNMALKATSFSPGYADVTDKFGITFQISTEAELSA